MACRLLVLLSTLSIMLAKRRTSFQTTHHNAYSSVNIADTESSIIFFFSIHDEKVGYFCSDNASHNDTCIATDDAVAP